ncbi:excalibur calcium-binding domain-containing protein [Blastococcus sp. CT_GayMR16]|uniref:excalibur calcium-binding domain-containing protein n=1 Tax=Blastococcus sp. CT_GayMR16 TaxID=2559607 RepID=UPI001ADDDC82|nr:excalibur calcium-binding domain-containing protein [Blastococcus sp. CT_GayMR16]
MLLFFGPGVAAAGDGETQTAADSAGDAIEVVPSAGKVIDPDATDNDETDPVTPGTITGSESVTGGTAGPGGTQTQYDSASVAPAGSLAEPTGQVSNSRSNTTSASGTAAEQGATEEEGENEDAENPADEDPAACIQGVGEQLMDDLEGLGTRAEDLATEFSTALMAVTPTTNPTGIPDLLQKLGEDAEMVGTDAAGFFATAVAGIAECLAAAAPDEEPPADDAGGGEPPAVQPSGVYYQNCTDARAQGATNIPRGAPGYRRELDSDNDDIACEDDTSPAVPPTTTPTASSGKLAYTGVDLEPLLRTIAILISSGTLLTLAGRRQA